MEVGSPKRVKVKGNIYNRRVPDGAESTSADTMGNPYKVQDGDRAAAVEKFRECMRSKPELQAAVTYHAIWKGPCYLERTLLVGARPMNRVMQTSYWLSQMDGSGKHDRSLLGAQHLTVGR